jgi:hypothetical protein
MMLTRKALSRRTVLRGLGTALALPLLDSMVPALTALRQTAAVPPRRFGVVYVPNGIIMEQWTPATAGAGFEFTPILKALEPFRERVLVLTGLVNEAGRGGAHPRAAAAFLTGVTPARTTGNAKLMLGVSMDQIAAATLGESTRVPSLELSLEGVDSNVVSVCDPGFSCAYMNISWRNESTPMPRETNPRVVFERLFGDAGSSDPSVRAARLRRAGSILDSVGDKVRALQAELPRGDTRKLDEYVESVRDVERRLQAAERQAGTSEMPSVASPAGIPLTYDEHARMMFDLQLLAYQTDQTRVTTFMFGRELSGATYPQVGVTDAHHPITHHLKDPANVAKVTKINTYHLSLFADYVKKLEATPDGDGSLLDHVMLLYGSPLSDGNRHSPDNLPLMLVGGGSGALRGGRHVRYATPAVLPNLQLALLERLGVPLERLGNSTGKIAELSGV